MKTLFRETKFIPSITFQLLEASFFYTTFHYSPSEDIIRETYQRHCTTQRLGPWLKSHDTAEFASSRAERSYYLGMLFAKDLHLGTTGSPSDLKKSCTNKSINAHNEKKSLHDKLTS